jgi:hypothetical protein
MSTNMKYLNLKTFLNGEWVCVMTYVEDTCGEL